MGKKFGPQFHKEFRHYTIIQGKIIKSLTLGSRLLKAVYAKTPLQHQLIPFIEILTELNMSTVHCFREGYTSSALILLRQVQEITHKIWAMYHKPSLAKKTKVSPSEVRKVMRENGFPDWNETYKALSAIAHANKSHLFDFLPIIGLSARVSPKSVMVIEYYLMILNLLTQKVLYVIFKSMKKNLGSDYRQLVQIYTETEQIIHRDWKSVHTKEYSVFGE